MTLKQQQQAKKFALQDLLSKSVLERSPRYQLQKTASINIFALQEMSDDFYLPSISTSHSEVYLDDRYCHLSRSSPYLLGSACISEAPRRSSQHRSNQLPHLNKDQQKFLKRPKQSNVRLTMAYLGQGALAECRDELRVFQQICGGENLCVYKGYLSPGDQFHFVSRRHLGFPFSATLFINGIMATRISCCCEYRYNIGYQQGKRGCFRLMHLSGGKPCYRCAGFKSLKNTSGRRTFENGSLGCCESHPVVEDQRCEKDFNQDTSLPGTAKEVSSKAAEAQEQPDGNDSSYASSPLFIPRYKVNRQRPLLKYDQPDAASASSDSEASERENRWRPKRGRKCPRAAPQKGNEATQQKEQQLEYQDLKFSQKTSNGNQSGAPLHPDHKKHFRKKKRNRTETKKDVASETAAPQNEGAEEEENKDTICEDLLITPSMDQHAESTTNVDFKGEKDTSSVIKSFDDHCAQKVIKMSQNDRISNPDILPDKQNSLNEDVEKNKWLQEIRSMAHHLPDSFLSDVELSDSSESSEHPRNCTPRPRGPENLMKLLYQNPREFHLLTSEQSNILKQDSSHCAIKVEDTGEDWHLYQRLASKLAGVRNGAAKPTNSVYLALSQHLSGSFCQECYDAQHHKAVPPNARNNCRPFPLTEKGKSSLAELSDSYRNRSTYLREAVMEKCSSLCPTSNENKEVTRDNNDRPLPEDDKVQHKNDLLQPVQSEPKYSKEPREEHTAVNRPEDPAPLPRTTDNEKEYQSDRHYYKKMNLEMVTVENTCASAVLRSEVEDEDSHDNDEVIKLLVNREPQEMHSDILQKQISDMIAVLEACDLVEQLVLRNTGLSDELLEALATALMKSPSEVEMINLNLNNIGPRGASTLIELLRVKSQVKSLLLFGNNLGDDGICTLMEGLAELHSPRADTGHGNDGDQQRQVNFTLTELDVGGNQISNRGIHSLAKFLEQCPPLGYLGLAQSPAVDRAGWARLFETLKTHDKLCHVILDENAFGNEGAVMFSEVLKANRSLCKVDLDSNNIGEEGADAILQALLSRRAWPMEHLSLEGNAISDKLLNEIKQQLKPSPA